MTTKIQDLFKIVWTMPYAGIVYLSINSLRADVSYYLCLHPAQKRNKKKNNWEISMQVKPNQIHTKQSHRLKIINSPFDMSAHLMQYNWPTPSVPSAY